MLVTSIVLVLIIANVPPADLPFTYNEQLKDDYAASIERAPWAHTEDATVEKVCKRLGLRLEEAFLRLRAADLAARDSTETLAEIACRQHTSPARIFSVLKVQSGHAQGASGRMRPHTLRCAR